MLGRLSPRPLGVTAPRSTGTTITDYLVRHRNERTGIVSPAPSPLKPVHRRLISGPEPEPGHQQSCSNVISSAATSATRPVSSVSFFSVTTDGSGLRTRLRKASAELALKYWAPVMRAISLSVSSSSLLVCSSRES